MKINLHQKTFKSSNNTTNGEVDESTIFHYYQKNNIIWATYEGGNILKGNIIGTFIPPNKLEFSYQHLNNLHEIMTGKCFTDIEIDENSKIILHEKWQWTCKDCSKGESKVIEI